MTRKEALARLREHLDRDALRPPAERFAEMVARGAIDEHGNVLLRSPHGESGLRHREQWWPDYSAHSEAAKVVMRLLGPEEAATLLASQRPHELSDDGGPLPWAPGYPYPYYYGRIVFTKGTWEV